jgi:hypothetical protein
MPNAARRNGLGTADASARPGSYALGSPQSRAAARSLLRARRTEPFKGLLVRFVSPLGCDDPDRKCTCPVTEDGTFGFCRCFL